MVKTMLLSISLQAQQYGGGEECHPLPGLSPWDITSCSVSNCLYVSNGEGQYPSLLRITKDEEHRFNN